MSSRTALIVKQPLELLRDVLIARTWELSPFLEEIDSVELTEHRQDDPTQQFASHVWRAKSNVPPMLAPHLDADYFSWTAAVEWNLNEYTSHWHIEPHALKEALSCVAIVTLKEALGGRATNVTIDVDIHGLDGRQGMETIAHRIVLVNWQKLVEAATRRLEVVQAC